MANLIIQDTFEPYYAGRDDDRKPRQNPRPHARKRERADEDEIVLPEEAPKHIATVRRDRRIIAH